MTLPVPSPESECLVLVVMMRYIYSLIGGEEKLIPGCEIK